MNNLSKRKHLRLRNYDYTSNGYYFITICTHDKKPLVKKYQKEIEDIISQLPDRFPGMDIDYYILMPTHVHLIIVFNNVKVTIGEVVRTFKALVSRYSKDQDFWQRNYYEHVIRTDKALYKIREYIQNNPLVDKVRFEQFYNL